MSTEVEYQHIYTVAGVRVVSNRKVKLPVAGFSDCRLHVRFVDDSHFQEPKDRNSPWFEVPTDSVAASLISQDGRKAIVSSCSLTADGAASEIRGIVPFASALQEAIILHASAVISGQSIVCFVGGSGAGKSTLAGALASRGYVIAADDLLPCRCLGRNVVVHADQRRNMTAFPLSALFFLTRNRSLAEPDLTTLTPKVCMKRLLENGFGNMTSKAIWTIQFLTYGLMANTIPAYDFVIPDDLSQLSNTTMHICQFLTTVERAR
ncbi:hypothetical protein N9H39_08170 [Gammaproteobacteria bacterium]|nr:hypothetical protein [Gammaproteobacteria bacterium]